MAVIWESKKNDTCYRVVQAGSAIRLYRNGVLHSQWNPNNPVSGKLWDLFILIALGLNVDLSKVLLLGAGGGSVINLIHHYYPNAEIQAVDFDRVHLQVAKKYFRVDTKKCELIYSDAASWLKNCGKIKYDLIIDDVFNETNNIPHRAIKNQKSWIDYLLRHLKVNGILVFNFADNKEWISNFELWQSSLKKKNIGISTHHLCENKIIHITNQEISVGKIKHALEAHIEFRKHLRKKLISYQAFRPYKPTHSEQYA